MNRHTSRPIIFALSNPTSCCEATPHDLVNWTEGRALIGTGSPFESVTFEGKKVTIAQPNNSYIFPGLALGIIASKARHVTDTMIMAAAKELARLVPTHKDKNANLSAAALGFTPLSRLIARAVGKRAIQDGEAQIADAEMLEHGWNQTFGSLSMCHTSGLARSIYRTASADKTRRRPEKLGIAA